MSNALELEQIPYKFMSNWIWTYTWATKPNYSLATVGTVINILDVGGEAGSFWKATSVGWVPLNGPVKLASQWGTVLAPVASVENAPAKFSVPVGAGSLAIPAGMIIPGHSVLSIRAALHKRGASLCTFRIYLGTSETSSDAPVYALNVTADLNDIYPSVEIGAVSSSSLTSTYWMPAGSSGSPSAITAVTANINTGAEMHISFIAINMEASNGLDLIGYSVVLESL
ncbi:hypothetical protein [Nitrosovibrio sp. Nv6]|uniref:hypothetical protein n=1 Tax=Nitrosovibrio sp. Nv6 TaxID=1855340 RepID=UPI0008B9B56A|nr:hypothetical protein [Nitrosovibrio sp. Nv6]SEO63442.1 hypothetical protein SAMN05216316_0670 [Nitrosovibrio sp. Nv6]